MSSCNEPAVWDAIEPSASTVCKLRFQLVRSASCKRSSDPGIAPRQKILARATPLLLFRKYLTFHQPVEQFSFASGWGGSLGTGSQVLGSITLWAYRPNCRVQGNGMVWDAMKNEMGASETDLPSQRMLEELPRFHRIVPTRQLLES